MLTLADLTKSYLIKEFFTITQRDLCDCHLSFQWNGCCRFHQVLQVYFVKVTLAQRFTNTKDKP